MYRVSPFTYLVGAVLSVGLSNAHVRCAEIELLHFEPTPGKTCGQYMKSFMQISMGYLSNPDARESCAYCPLDAADGFLRSYNIRYEDRWRNFGIMWAFVAFNIAGAFLLYRLVRVPKKHTWVGTPKSGLTNDTSITALVGGQEKELAKAQRTREMLDEGKCVSSAPTSRAGPGHADCEL
jgi:ATP-binding cassette subfamily G (WHITE) protein 2 (PDR)